MGRLSLANPLSCEVLSLIRRKYSGTEGGRLGPTLAAEHLAEEDEIVLDHETLRRWMLEEGLWSRRRKRKKHCRRRERKPHFGELVQLDGRFHNWLEERGPRDCVMNMVDDASSTTQMRLGKLRGAPRAVHGLEKCVSAKSRCRSLFSLLLPAIFNGD